MGSQLIRYLFFIILFWCSFYLSCAFSADLLQRIETPSSFNPVGSGARALGMGGAFIAVADDATAASWNPGGLTQLESPEISLVMAGFHRTEQISLSTHPEADGRETVDKGALNYLSAAYPFSFLGKDMIVSLNYQRLYDFTRQWTYALNESGTGFSRHDRIDYRQDGDLSAVGLAYAVNITPLFSLGITANRWDETLSPNEWDQEVVLSGNGEDRGEPFAAWSRSVDQYAIEGTNFHFGMLWRINTDWTVGAVLKTPFEADLRHHQSFSGRVDYSNLPGFGSRTEYSSDTDETLEMPMSYGVGIAWQITRTFRTAMDVYRTEWDDFVLQTEAGAELSPITGGPAGESNIDPTTQVRFGTEYLYIKDKLILPLTAGVFYDPAPAPGSPDDIYGLSLGTGIGFKRVHVDLAYQYRYGEDTAKYILRKQGFSLDLSEHTLFASVVFHL